MVGSPPRNRIEYFTSAKTTRPIPVDGDLFRHALIRATLDPAVRSIDSFPCAISRYSPRLAIVARDDGRFAFGLNGDALSSAAQLLGDSERLPTLMLTEKELRSEPRYANEGLIWLHRKRRVSNGIRFQILRALAVSGPMRLGDLISAVQIAHRSTTAAFAMVCADLVEFDDLSSRPVGTDTIIRRRVLSASKPAVADATHLRPALPDG